MYFTVFTGFNWIFDQMKAALVSRRDVSEKNKQKYSNLLSDTVNVNTFRSDINVRSGDRVEISECDLQYVVETLGITAARSHKHTLTWPFDYY